MSNLNDFIIHSQYPVEKIIWTAEGQNDSTNPNWQSFSWGGYVFEPFDDNIDYQNLLVDGVWTNDNWTTQYPIESNSKPMGYVDAGGSYILSLDFAGAWVVPKGFVYDTYTTTHPCVIITGTQSDSDRVIQYRYWAYLIESDWSSNTTTKTAGSLAHSLQKNTNLAQLNMISENVLKLQDRETKVLYHNLGFRPLCKIWKKWGSANTWNKDLQTITDTTIGSLIQNQITIDSEKITIYAQDDSQHQEQDFLIRIFNYDIAV